MPMPSQSSRSIRASEIPNSVSREEFLEAAKNIIAEPAKKKSFFSFTTSVTDDQNVAVSLASQFGEKFGTITFPSTKYKEKALKEKAKWKYDDYFDGITVLHSGSSVKLE
jgi:hypothetical protein